MIFRCLRFENRRASRRRLSIKVFRTVSEELLLIEDVGVGIDEYDTSDLAVFIATSISPNLP